MTTRRRIICCILSALWFASCSLINSGPPQRIVRVKALADPSFRARNPAWDQEVRGVIESASDYFEREFAIRLVTQSTAPWPAEERIPSTANLLVKLRHEFPVQENDGSYDLLVVFTAESVSRYLPSGRSRVDRIGDCQQGLGNYVVTTADAVFRYQGANSDLAFDVLTFIHELGHIFGATHVDDRTSIMHQDFGYRTEFDLTNRGIIQKNRTCAFAK